MEDIIFTPEGKRIEKVVYAPVISLRQISLTPEDVQDLRNVQPFVLTTPEIPDYDIQYLGKEKVDDIGCYSVLGEAQEDGEGQALFRGPDLGGRPRSADREDLRQRRRTVEEETEPGFPKFETYREQIDGKYWFPTYTRANDTLHFKRRRERAASAWW